MKRNDSIVQVPPRKITAGMRDALTCLSASLVCPICDEILKEPSTLASCAHTFCRECITDHTQDSWLCPYPGCGMSVAIRGEKSFLRSNPSLSSVVTSLEQITSALTQARDDWWKQGSLVSSQISPDDSKNQHTDRENQPAVSFQLPRSENSFIDDDEIVDFQAQTNHIQDFRTPSDWTKICRDSISTIKKRFFSSSTLDTSAKRTKFQSPTEQDDSPSTVLYDKMDDDITSLDTPSHVRLLARPRLEVKVQPVEFHSDYQATIRSLEINVQQVKDENKILRGEITTLRGQKKALEEEVQRLKCQLAAKS